MANNFWASLGQIALAAVTSYGAAKLSSSQTSWATYRNAMLQQTAAVALNTAIQQYTAVVNTETPTQAETVSPTE